MNCKICVSIYGFIESNSKPAEIYVVVHVHFIVSSVDISLSSKYIHIELVLLYWSYCELYSAVLVAAVMQAV